MALRSDTRIPAVAEAAPIPKKEGTSEGDQMNKPKMAPKKGKQRTRSKGRRAREVAVQVADDKDGYFRFDTDVLWEILLRLSIESLLACRCVCKSWYNMTKDPDFVDTHMKISSKQPPRFIGRTIFRAKVYAEPDRLLLCDIQHNKARIMPLKEYLFHYKQIIYSHNGLLCLAPNNCGTRAPMVICNPITTERFELPRPDEVEYCSSPLVGFCFVPTRQKHVVVQLSTTRNTEDFKRSVTRFYILTSGQSSWRQLTHCPCSMDCTFIGNTVYWNNGFHWIFWDGGSDANHEYNILSFDTVHETFQVISCPDDIYDFQQLYNLLVLNSRLTLVKRYENKMKLWEMMGDRAGEFSLVGREVYDFGIDSKSFALLPGPSNKVHLLTIMQNAASDLVCRDFIVASKDMKWRRTIPIIGLSKFFNIFTYNPSLISVGSMDLPRHRRPS